MAHKMGKVALYTAVLVFATVIVPLSGIAYRANENAGHFFTLFSLPINTVKLIGPYKTENKKMPRSIAVSKGKNFYPFKYLLWIKTTKHLSSLDYFNESDQFKTICNGKEHNFSFYLVSRETYPREAGNPISSLILDFDSINQPGKNISCTIEFSEDLLQKFNALGPIDWKIEWLSPNGKIGYYYKLKDKLTEQPVIPAT